MKNTNYTIDASGKIFGRLASRVAVLLRGKNNVSFQLHILAGQEVVVKNIRNIKFSGKKYDQKVYMHHSGYLGHLREDKLSHLFAKNPEKVFVKTVYNMLPKNKLRRQWIKNLKFE